MAPGPVISATVNVCPGMIFTDGDTFQPWPKSREAVLPVPSVAIPPLPFSPVGFSGLIERVFAFESRGRLPRFKPSPLNPGEEGCATADTASQPNTQVKSREVSFMGDLGDRH